MQYQQTWSWWLHFITFFDRYTIYVIKWKSDLYFWQCHSYTLLLQVQSKLNRPSIFFKLSDTLSFTTLIWLMSPLVQSFIDKTKAIYQTDIMWLVETLCPILTNDRLILLLLFCDEHGLLIRCAHCSTWKCRLGIDVEIAIAFYQLGFFLWVRVEHWKVPWLLLPLIIGLLLELGVLLIALMLFVRRGDWAMWMVVTGLATKTDA